MPPKPTRAPFPAGTVAAVVVVTVSPPKMDGGDMLIEIQTIPNVQLPPHVLIPAYASAGQALTAGAKEMRGQVQGAVQGIGLAEISAPGGKLDG